jgi:hypothetical protein
MLGASLVRSMLFGLGFADSAALWFAPILLILGAAYGRSSL